MAPPLLALTGIRLTFGGTPLLEGAELSVVESERICLVGRNGSGKSTLLKIAAGLVEADRGERVLQGRTSVRYLPQEPDFGDFPTVLAYVLDGLGANDDANRAHALLGELGLTGDEEPGRLSGGEARRAALVRTLAPSPDVLLLDEPTNHLDLPAIEWLEQELKAIRSALVLISHDRRFLERLSTATVWLDRGVTRRLDKGFAAFEAWRDDLISREEEERHKLDRRIAREIEWLHYGGITARRRRNEGRKRALDAMRETRRDARSVQGNVKMSATEADPSGKLVIEAKGISKSFGGVPVVADLSIRIGRGDRIGIVGPNGAGKTTLVSLLTGVLPPDDGTIRFGTRLEMISLDQRREELDPDATVAEVLTGGRGDTVLIGGASKHVVSYMKDFLFASEQARTPTAKLSGGERGRLMLARALAKPSNLMVLDEPTNDLDLETLDILQEMLADYQGTVLLVSHDRDFLDRVVTSVIASEGEGRWTEYAGGYSDMVAQRGGGVSAKAEAKAARGEPAPRVVSKAPSKRKLSFKEKHALETLPKQIEKLQLELAALDARMADAAFYAEDPAGFAKAAARSGTARAELTALEDEWLALELLREEIGG
jgi:ATP-binding cassette subfamily F protein uup